MGCKDSKPLNYEEFIKLMRRRNLRQILNREFNEVTLKEQCAVENVEAPILPKENKSGANISVYYLDSWAQKRRFICTQAPREKTEFKFWRMILKHRVQIIVMLCEDSEEQFYKYWESDEGVVKTVRPFRIETVKVKYFSNYKVTTLDVTNNATGEFLEVIHFACTDWVQFCTIQGTIDFCNFIHDIRSVSEGKKNNLLYKRVRDCIAPIVVHCTYGFRAAEVFCAIDNSSSEYDANHTISLPLTVAKIREQKHKSFINFSDYILCYILMFRFVTLIRAEEICSSR
ncbi:tyrosine-protein phosphatase non-receptor type 9-like [Cotesia typhae]|uniref:tyrosine-protein phosphatase non-receptor type 9-like n=1 Tax=Cotesia typhae TaxID=2053667 RepID=UPI003D68391F